MDVQLVSDGQKREERKVWRSPVHEPEESPLVKLLLEVIEEVA